MIGVSTPMRQLREFIGKAAPSDATVLIQGESGTGKELVAQALHRQSRRSDRPFVAVNCAALPDTLAESVLFGYERGAFTGAAARQKGKFELAAGGTLFFDEVGELNAAVQAKLLRAVQERMIDRVGGTHPIPVDIRFVAATNRNLKAEVFAGRFREDLYHRLNVVSVTLAPLRARPEDIQALADHFIAVAALNCGRVVRGISPEAATLLQEYNWPGNVRELQHVIEQAVALGDSEVVRREDLPSELLGEKHQSDSDGYYEILYRTQRRIFEDAFAKACGDYKKAAEILKLRAKDMHRFLKRLDLTYLLKRPRQT